MSKIYSLYLTIFHSLRSIFRTRADLTIEILALRQQLIALKEKHPRPRLSWIDRGFWVLLRRLWPKWNRALVIVKPETVVKWHRRGFRWFWRRISMRGKRSGRRRISLEIRHLIVRMASENPTWRAPKIHGELLMLGFNVSERTISRYLPRREPDPERVQKWKTFLRNHRDVIAAMDFFTVPTATFRTLYVWFAISHDRRKIRHINVTYHPTAEWTKRQITEAFPWDTAPKYLFRDRGSAFGAGVFRKQVKNLGITEVISAPGSPWQNPYVERFIGSIRRECLDHMIIFSRSHLIRILSSTIITTGLTIPLKKTHCLKGPLNQNRKNLQK